MYEPIVLLLLCLAGIACYECEDLDPRMVTCGEDCCPAGQSGFNLAGGSFSEARKAGLGVLFDALSSVAGLDKAPPSIRVPNVITASQRVKSVCCGSSSCSFTARGCLTKFNPVVTKAPLPTKVLDDYNSAVADATRECKRCDPFLLWSDGNGIAVASSLVDCLFTYKGATCPVYCTSNIDKVMTATCNCDGKWYLDKPSVTTYCRSSCPSTPKVCSVDSSFGVLGLQYAEGHCPDITAGGLCKFSCRLNKASFQTACSCSDGKRYALPDAISVCEKCADTTILCSKNPVWLNDRSQVIASTMDSSCSRFAPGDTCNIKCSADSGKSFSALCRCDGNWWGAVQSACPLTLPEPPSPSPKPFPTPTPSPTPAPTPGSATGFCFCKNQFIGGLWADKLQEGDTITVTNVTYTLLAIAHQSDVVILGYDISGVCLTPGHVIEDNLGDYLPVDSVSSKRCACKGSLGLVFDKDIEVMQNGVTMHITSSGRHNWVNVLVSICRTLRVCSVSKPLLWLTDMIGL